MNDALVRIDEKGVKLAHYTSFEVAKLIVQGRSVWMRNARNMNDVGEIAHGIEAMDQFMAAPGNKARIEEVLSPFAPTLPAQLESVWQHLRNVVATEVYICCFSEHLPAEDPYGRLSMWRAYCAKPDGVAFVLDPAAFRLKSNALNAYSSPVFYGDAAAFAVKLHEVLDNIQREANALAEVGPMAILSSLAMALLFGAVCLKHPGFAEEQEWRIIHMPSIVLPSRLRKRDMDGETVFEIPLEDYEPAGLVGIEPDALIHKIIIGPSLRAELIEDELEGLLTAQGVTEARDRIFRSGIPLRVPKSALQCNTGR